PGSPLFPYTTLFRSVQHLRERLGVRAELRDALVVLESGDARDVQFRRHVADELADGALLAAAGADVEQPEPGKRLALLAAELPAEDLVARAHPEHHRAGLHGAGQAAVVGEALRREDL